MAQQTINVGTDELAGDGESLRSAFGKINTNFTELYSTSAGLGDLVLTKVSGVVDAGTPVTMDLLQVQMSTSGNRSLQIASTTGTFTAMVGGQASYDTTQTASSSNIEMVVFTSMQTMTQWNFTSDGDTGWYHIMDRTNNRFYRVSFIVGPSFNNNFISIERLL